MAHLGLRRDLARALLVALSACDRPVPGEGAGPAAYGSAEAPPPAPAIAVALRVGEGEHDGADGHQVDLCLAEGRCFSLDHPQADTLRRGRVDAALLEGAGLTREQVDRVELRSREGGEDAARPACLSVEIDGELVHCRDGDHPLLGAGDDPGEVASFREPGGPVVACDSCWPERVTHGPVVGAVGPDHARIWVRTDRTREVELLVVADEGPGEPALLASAGTRATDDFTTTFHLEGLAPARRYRAFAFVDGEPSERSASFTTAPPPGRPGRLRLAYGSCARRRDQPIFSTIAEARPDVMLFGGDNHYADSPDLGSHWAQLRQALEIPERAALLSTTPTLAIWDDHDFVANDSHAALPGGASALRAFEDYWPNASLGLPDVPGVFGTFAWGDVELFLLDVRMHRSPPHDRDGSLLGEAQTAWLEQRLRASRATFKLLVSGTVWSPSAGETWLDVPDARESLFDFLAAERVTGVVLLAGDLHRGMLRRIHRPEAYALPEIISSPLANRNWRCPPKVREVVEIACVDDGDLVALIDVDTTAPDPSLAARLVGADGRERARLVVHASELR